MSAASANPAIHQPDNGEQTGRRRQHLLILGAALGVIVLAALMTTVNDRQVAFAGLSRFPLPELCQSRRWLGLDCPGCGLTRSFIHFFHGRWQESFAMHRLGWLLALVTVLQVPYRLLALATPGGLPLGKAFPWAIGCGLAILFTLNWLAKLAGW